MIYIKRIVNADITRQIDLTKEVASSFFKYEEGDADKNVSFLNEETRETFNGTIKKTGHTSTIIGEIYSEIHRSCSLDDLWIVRSTRGDFTYTFSVVKKGTQKYPQYEKALNLFGSKSAVLGSSTHLLATLDNGSESVEHKSIENSDISPNYLNYLAALRTKPFMLLAGISGTGKSRIVREMAKACWKEGDADYGKNKPSNFEMVQVKPNWHDSSEVFGYVSRIGDKPHFVAGDFLKFVAKAWEHLDKPYFLCLDEMNLAPVEQYFAEYLSVIESRKLADDGKTIYTDPILKTSADSWWWDLCCELTESEDLRIKFRDNGIALPQNLFVIGTVNMDETTYSFSRKVLDRAMTIEMNEVNLDGGLDKNAEKEFSYIEADAIIGTAVEGCDVYAQKKAVCDAVLAYLQAVNDKLEGTPFKIAYRTRNEFLVYAVNRLLLSNDENKDALLKVAMDEMTSMKILSRIEGERSKCVKPLEGIRDVLKGELTEDQQADSVSLKKIDCMLKKGDYISYWD